VTGCNLEIFNLEEKNWSYQCRLLPPHITPTSKLGKWVQGTWNATGKHAMPLLCSQD